MTALRMADFGVIPVTGNCGVPNTTRGGYISVGTTSSTGIGCQSLDVYVVRTDRCGNAYWERTYDITGINRNDVGYSIIEVANPEGFIITGSAETPNGDVDAF